MASRFALTLPPWIDDQSVASVMIIPRGHYTLDSLTKEIQNVFGKYGVELPTEINTPVGQLIITNPENKIIGLDRDLAKLLGIDRKLYLKTFIKRIATPSSYFIHCDLVDKEQNLLNGKPSSLLVKFDIRGKAFEKVYYQTPPQHVLRNV